MSDSLVRQAGWSAYANAVLTLLNIATISLFFATGGFWGTLNDGVSVFWILSFVPVAVLFSQLHRSVNPAVSLITAAAGIVVMVAFALLQFLLVIGMVSFEQTIGAILTLGGLVGLFLLIHGLLAQAGQTLPSRVIWSTLIYGLGYMAAAVGFWVGGMWHPLATAGFAMGTFAGVLWGIWLGRFLLNGRVPRAAAVIFGGS